MSEDDQTPTGEIEVTIVDTATGRRAVDRTNLFHDWESFLTAYYWGEGNAACDGNRAEHFARALGEPIPECHDCGDRRFRVDQIVRLSDGAVIYQDA